jgi:cytidylate kinase
MKKNLVIAIDGPSASGKGTLAKKISAHFNLPYLNTGALYRLVALRVMEREIAPAQFEEHILELVKTYEPEEINWTEIDKNLNLPMIF